MVEDWVSYDSIAQTYERLVSRRLAGPARTMAARLAGGPAPKRILDLGTGTGVATHALESTLSSECKIFGVDLSREMLLVARRTGLTRLAVADATQLPFPSDTFDIVIASFLISHVPEPSAVIREVVRVLGSGGRFAATAWAESRVQSSLQSDWRTIASRYVSEEGLDSAQAAVVPSETRVAESEHLRDICMRNGLQDVHVMKYDDTYEVSLEDHITERAAYSGGRFMRATLTPERWQGFLTEVGEYLRSRHSQTLSLDNSFLLAIGRKPKGA